MSDDRVRAPVAPGDVLAGKYRVERVLGIGGMGVVVAATHLELEELVALKFLLPEIAQNAEAVERFLREAKAAVRIRSEHVAGIKDVGRLADGAPYMVMEYLQGEDVSQLLERGALPIPIAVDYILQAIEAIAQAHALGIVHRDLKPGNLFVTRRPDATICIKVLDFGIAKTLQGLGGAPGMALTSTSNIVGTPLYMSPEQLASSRDLDARADIWALGVILFEMLTQQSPFIADTMPQLCTAIVGSAPRSLAALRRDAPPELCVAVERCVAKSPSGRFPTVADLAEAIAHLTSDGHVSAERARRIVGSRGSFADAEHVGAPALTVGHGGPTAGGITLPRRARRSPLIGAAIVGGTIGIGIVVVAIAVVRGGGSQGAVTPAETTAAAARDTPPALGTATAAQSPPASAAEVTVEPAPSAAPTQQASAKRRSPRTPPPPSKPKQPGSSSGLDLPDGRK